MEESIVDRFLRIPELEGISKNKFEASIGKASGYFNVLKKRGSVPGADLVQTFISEYPKYSLRWILLGEGNPKEEKEYKRKSIVMMEEPEKYANPDGLGLLARDLLLKALEDPEVMDRIQEIAENRNKISH